MISRMISRMAWGPADHYDASAPHIIPTGQHLQPAYATFLMGVLQSNTVLTELVLSSNELRDEGAIALAKGLRRNRTLELLACNGCAIKTEGAKALGGGARDERRPDQGRLIATDCD